MRIEKAAAIALLGFGCPVMLWASTLYSRASCQIDRTQGVVSPIGYRPDAYLLMVLLGVGQGALAGMLAAYEVKKKRFASSPTPAINSAPTAPSLPASTVHTVNIGSAQIKQVPAPLEGTNERPQTASPINASTPPFPLQPALSGLEKLGIIGQLVNTPIPRNYLLSAVSRVGKTTTIRAIVYGIWLRHKGKVIFRIVDPKKDKAGWLGLERLRDVVTYAVDSIAPVLARLQEAYQLMIYRIENSITDGLPFYLIVDEWFGVLEVAKQLGLEKQLLFQVGEVCRKGLGVGIHLVLITQSHLVKNSGIDTQSRYGFIFAAIGRRDVGYEMLWNAVKDDDLIPDENTRRNLKLQIDRAIAQASQSGLPVMLTTYQGGSVEVLPNLQWLALVEIGCESLSQEGNAHKGNTTATDESPSPNLREQLEGMWERTVDLERELDLEREQILDLESSTERDEAPEDTKIGSDEPNEPEARDSKDSDDVREQPEQLPNWFLELPEPALKALYQSIKANRTGGKSRSWIVKEILNGKSENYKSGAAAYDYLMQKYESEEQP